jgi:hypothetical protein
MKIGPDGMSDDRRVVIWLMYWLRGLFGLAQTIAEAGPVTAVAIVRALPYVVPEILSDETAFSARDHAETASGGERRAADWLADYVLGMPGRDAGGDVTAPALMAVLKEVLPEIRTDPQGVAERLAGGIPALIDDEDAGP